MSIGVLKADGGSDDIVFEASADKMRTWSEARRTAKARWHTHDVFSGKQKREFLGPGLSEISLTVRLDMSRGVVPRDELRKMRKLMNTGVVLQFSVGGEFVGEYTLEGVDETWTRMSREGVLTTAIVGLQLEEYA